MRSFPLTFKQHWWYRTRFWRLVKLKTFMKTGNRNNKKRCWSALRAFDYSQSNDRFLSEVNLPKNGFVKAFSNVFWKKAIQWKRQMNIAWWRIIRISQFTYRWVSMQLKKLVSNATNFNIYENRYRNNKKNVDQRYAPSTTPKAMTDSCLK